MIGKVFKAYDVRGTYPDPLNETLARQIGCGVARYLHSALDDSDKADPMLNHVVVGRDMRKSSPKMTAALIEGIRIAGSHVIDVGMVDTSFIYFAINHLGCGGGVMVTASHNPPQYNGFKISGRNARPIGTGSGLEQVKRFAATVDLEREPEPSGRVEKRDLWPDYTDHVHQFLELDRPLRVVVDLSNGMAGAFMPHIFDDIEDLELITLNKKMTGEFAHDPNPLVVANLDQVRQAVRDHEADFGVCFDGDADRCAFVDENGDVVSSDLFAARMAEHFLRFSPGSPIVYDLRSSKAFVEHVEACGGKPVRSRVGHVFMKARMKEHDAVFGAELSAHVYYRDNFYADSGAITFATALTILSQQDKTLSRFLDPLNKYVASGETNFEVEDKQAMMDQIKRTYAADADIDELDGVTVDAFNTSGFWFNVRPSNTEPLLRLNMEARDEKTLKKMFDEVKDLLGEPVAH